MRILTAVAALVFLGTSLTGCAGEAEPVAEPTTTATATQAPAGASTIEEVFDKLGCKTDDMFGTRGMVQDHTFGPELERTGSCSPIDDAERVVFYEASDEKAMDAYIASRKLEAGPGDALYRDGAILMLAQDAANAKALGERFESVDY